MNAGLRPLYDASPSFPVESVSSPWCMLPLSETVPPSLLLVFYPHLLILLPSCAIEQTLSLQDPEMEATSCQSSFPCSSPGTWWNWRWCQSCCPSYPGKFQAVYYVNTHLLVSHGFQGLGSKSRLIDFSGKPGNQIKYSSLLLEWKALPRIGHPQGWVTHSCSSDESLDDLFIICHGQYHGGIVPSMVVCESQVHTPDVFQSYRAHSHLPLTIPKVHSNFVQRDVFSERGIWWFSGSSGWSCWCC